MLKTFIVIPTYWGRLTGQAPQLGDALFDHPTPVDGESTLPRLLQSLQQQEGAEFAVLIITAAVTASVEATAAQRVAELIAPYREAYPIAQFDAAELAFLRQCVPALTVAPAPVTLRSYPTIRNLQLIVPHILGAEKVIALDDDEVVAPDYVRRAVDVLDQEQQGERVCGAAGFYLDAAGEILLPESPHTGNIFRDKAAIMNAGTRALQSAPGRLVATPVAFGGNMLFHRDLFTRVGFDPGITRGEDIDYLINARLAGLRFWLDKELPIIHLPPTHYDSSPYGKLQQDAIRFIYEREKLKHSSVDPAYFDPYPGRFLRAGVAEHALAALRSAATPVDVEQFGLPWEIVTEARRHARVVAPHYAVFARRWPALLRDIGDNQQLQAHWQAIFNF